MRVVVMTKVRVMVLLLLLLLIGINRTINFTAEHRMVALLQQRKRRCRDSRHAAAEH
jgi:hypothetical protein